MESLETSFEQAKDMRTDYESTPASDIQDESDVLELGQGGGVYPDSSEWS